MEISLSQLLNCGIEIRICTDKQLRTIHILQQLKLKLTLAFSGSYLEYIFGIEFTKLLIIFLNSTILILARKL